jgi:hypothetical protein
MSGTHQLYVEIWKARGLGAPALADMVILSATQMLASSCSSPQLRRDLAFEQDHCNVPGGVMLLTKSDPADISLADIMSAPAAVVSTT